MALRPSYVARSVHLLRIDGDALFVTNGRSFEGHSGGAFSNTNGGTAMYDETFDWCNVSVRSRESSGAFLALAFEANDTK